MLEGVNDAQPWNLTATGGVTGCMAPMTPEKAPNFGQMTIKQETSNLLGMAGSFQPCEPFNIVQVEMQPCSASWPMNGSGLHGSVNQVCHVQVRSPSDTCHWNHRQHLPCVVCHAGCYVTSMCGSRCSTRPSSLSLAG